MISASGCLEETPAAKDTDTGAGGLVGNVTATLAVKYAGNLGRRVCATTPTMCQPGGGGGPGGGTGMLTGSSQNPHTEVVNGTPQSVSLKIEWSAAPGGNMQLEAVVSAVQGASGSGGGGGGGGTAPREIIRKTGASPLTIEVPDAKWDAKEGRLRVMLYMTSRAPGGAPFVGVSADQPFSVSGTYTTLVPAPAAANATAPK
ncbi:MAG: hypothetical protein HYT80_11690 [Euryarchaeota archaeon]|nr:hypothetical protein [Euryarchaeota archaeon]